MLKKLQILFVPFLLALIGQAIVYTFLHWLLVVKWELIPHDELIINQIMPFIVSLGVYYVFLGLDTNLLKYNDESGKSIFLYFLTTTALLGFPTVLAQYYMQKETGKLTNLDQITQIDQKHPTRYYTFKKYHIDTFNYGFHYAYSISGKHDRDYNMLIYYTLPVLASESDTAGNVCKAWCAFEYKKTISNSSDSVSKQEAFNKFAQDTWEQFVTIDHRKYVYFERLEDSDIENGYLEARASNDKYNSKNPVFLEASKEPYAMHSKKALNKLGLVTAICVSIYFFMILMIKFDPDKL